MKKIALILGVVIITLMACQKNKLPEGLNPTQDPWGFVFEYTRVNCGICGGFGGPLLHDLHESGNVVTIAAHVTGGNDPMETNFHNAVYQDRPHNGGIPFFWVGNVSCVQDDAKAKAEINLIKSKTPECGVDLDYTLVGTTMTVKTKTKFFSAVTGSYKISVIVLEDDIPGDVAGPYEQAGGAAGYKHMSVLRDVAMGTFYGDNLITDPIADQEIEGTYTFTLGADWVPENCYAVALIWKYDPSATTVPTHEFINAKEFRLVPTE